MSDIDECSSSSSSSENDENVPDNSSLRLFNFEPEFLKEEQSLLSDRSDSAVVRKKLVAGTIIRVLVRVTVDQYKRILGACVVLIRNSGFFFFIFVKIKFTSTNHNKIKNIDTWT